MEIHPDYRPLHTHEGRWKHEDPPWMHWCDGFLPGMMWIFHRQLGNKGKDAKWWKDQAIRYTKPLEERKSDRNLHDLGFIFLPTYYRWYMLDRKEELNKVLIEAGKTLAGRYQEQGQYLASSIAASSLSIDFMMNVGLIFYAARETKELRLREIALRHCYTSRRYLVRGDGSTAQEVEFNTETGEVLRRVSRQGYRSDSCWTRGLAWALYGFGTAFEYSRDPRFLLTAESCADYYITHAPIDGVPPWDFNAPAAERSQLDTSAAAVAAAGFLRLCRLLPDPVKGHFYWSTAIRILQTLCELYLAENDTAWEGILKGGVYHAQQNIGVDESVMWGEYYFVEAIEHALRRM